MKPAIYEFLERASPVLILWSFSFTLIHSLRIVRRFWRRHGQVRDNALLTELAGLPLTLLQSVAFVIAALHGDGWSMLLFLWWGPGFLAVAALVIVAHVRRRRIDWHPFRYLISYLCKFSYLAYMLVFFELHMPGIMFAFSVWIINDQYEKAWMSLDTDRTRRTFTTAGCSACCTRLACSFHCSFRPPFRAAITPRARHATGRGKPLPLAGTRGTLPAGYTRALVG